MNKIVSTNAVVAKAILANVTKVMNKLSTKSKHCINAFDFEKHPADREVARACMSVCLREAEKMLKALIGIKSAVMTPHIYNDMDEKFKKYYDCITDMETDIKFFIALCKTL